MASIEVLPVEVVHAIIAHVDARDLLAIALVSHFFNIVATPGIYAKVRYTDSLAKKWGKVVCPLELLSARSDLLACLKSLELNCVPKVGSGVGDPSHPEFVRVCLDVVKRAPELAFFSWGIRHSNDLTHRMRYFYRDMTDYLTPKKYGPPSLDTLLFKHLGSVEHINLPAVSAETNKAFVEWVTSGLKGRLTSLSILGNRHLELSQLRRVLDHTPNLKSLKIIYTQCIALSELLPLLQRFKLESLALDAERNMEDPSAMFPIIPTLRRISFDIHPPNDSTELQNDSLNDQLLLRILEGIKCYTLHSLTLRLSSLRTLKPNTLNALIATHAHTLRTLHLFRLRIPAQFISSLIQQIPGLEDLGVAFREIQNGLDPIIEALPAARHLHTLTDTTLDLAWQHTTPVLSDSEIEQLLKAGPALKYVVSFQDGLEWVKSYDWNGEEMETLILRRRVTEY